MSNEHYVALLASFLMFLICTTYSKTSFSSNNFFSKNRNHVDPYPNCQPDRFVTSAPLALAAKCKDGTLLLALHTHSSTEPLLLSPPRITNRRYRFLPASNRGPFRITRIDEIGSHMLCAGWRTDNDRLMDRGRKLSRKLEISSFDIASLYELKQVKQCFIYGRSLAHSLGLYMSNCCFDDNTRALRTVAFLSIPSPISRESFLWLIDASGAYQIRAHAVGTNSEYFNTKIQQMNFDKISVHEARNYILDIVEKEEICLREANSFKIIENSEEECRYWNRSNGLSTVQILPVAVEYVHAHWEKSNNKL